MKKIHTFAIISVLFTLFFTTLLVWIYMYTHQTKLPSKITISGLAVGGQDIHSVIKDLDQKLQALEDLPLHLKAGNRTISTPKLTLHHAGVRYSANEFKQAAAGLSEGNMIQRLLGRLRFQKDWSISYSYDRTELQRYLSPAWEQSEFGDIIPAKIHITEMDEIEFIPEHSASRLNWAEMTRRLKDAVPADFSMLMNPIEPRPTIVIDLPLQVMNPSVTIDSLRRSGIHRKIIQVSTPLGTSGEGRTHNVTAAANAVDGMILKPGDELNYGQIVKMAEQHSGFKEAPVIVGGELVPGIGGGICQVSSTLYNAALKTGLQIVERRNHSLPVSYMPKGLDATFATDYINFRFKNTTGKSLLIKAEVRDRELVVKFFGTMPENVSYELETLLLETLPAPTEYTNDSSLPVNTQAIVQEGAPGYIVESYQIKRINGEIVSRTSIAKDTYRPQARLIAVNSDNHSPEKEDRSEHAPSDPAPPVEDGVRTQETNGN
ncbi:VanW family protein [Paenibacillus provencensis]|uniref:VanW family protein n=1 Tax=Paenibacillus provencensis TaxID=441151 RepID=A0ABW3Q059_9BACL|nr:VanW family protein [Paenibacillus sp. MER 78]